MRFFDKSEHDVVIVHEGMEKRAEVFTMDNYNRQINLRITAQAHIGKHVWYYTFDEASNTWTRSRKFKWYGGRLVPSGKEIRGLRQVPELLNEKVI